MMKRSSRGVTSSGAGSIGGGGATGAATCAGAGAEAGGRDGGSAHERLQAAARQCPGVALQAGDRGRAARRNAGAMHAIVGAAGLADRPGFRLTLGRARLARGGSARRCGGRGLNCRRRGNLRRSGRSSGGRRACRRIRCDGRRGRGRTDRAHGGSRHPPESAGMCCFRQLSAGAPPVGTDEQCVM